MRNGKIDRRLIKRFVHGRAYLTKLQVTGWRGVGAWARDPDSIPVMTPQEEENCFSVTSILRCLPQVPEFVVEWEYPLLRKAGDLDPGSLRTRGGRQKACTDREFLDAITTRPTSRKILLEKCGELGLSERTFDRYLKRLIENGVICTSSGLYWRKEQRFAILPSPL